MSFFHDAEFHSANKACKSFNSAGANTLLLSLIERFTVTLSPDTLIDISTLPALFLTLATQGKDFPLKTYLLS